MKNLILKLTPALVFGLSLTLSLLGLMTYLHTQTAHAAGPHYVAPSCAGVPAPCYTTIQAAVDAAAPGDVIMVAAGTYMGVTSRVGVTQTVYISKSVTIRGGYTTAFTEPSDPQANPTTLDAQGKGRVLYITGNISPTIEGLRITGGDATAGGMGDNGGGVFVSQAAAVFSNNQIFSNVADSFNISSGFGGGVFLGMDSSVLNRNIIIGNTASHGGGGLLLIDSKATLNGNTIASNEACIIGGGLDILYSDAGVTLNNNTVTNNTANSFCSNNPTNGTGGVLY